MHIFGHTGNIVIDDQLFKTSRHDSLNRSGTNEYVRTPETREYHVHTFFYSTLHITEFRVCW